jgi:hypothetical protein
VQTLMMAQPMDREQVVRSIFWDAALIFDRAKVQILGPRVGRSGRCAVEVNQSRRVLKSGTRFLFLHSPVVTSSSILQPTKLNALYEQTHRLEATRMRILLVALVLGLLVEELAGTRGGSF